MKPQAQIFALLIVLLAVVPVLTQAQGIEALPPTVSWVTVGEEPFTQVEITFTLEHPLGQSYWIALWGHDAVTRAYFPMQHFVEGPIEDTMFPPGTHTLTWVAESNAAGRQSDNFQVFIRVSEQGRVAAGRYLIVDVSGGSSAAIYPVTYVDNIDATQDEYKTDKIVLRELPDGSYAGLYPVTQQQYQHVTGQTPSYFSGNIMRPVEQVSWDTLTDTGSYGGGFIAALREKTGLSGLDLPASDAWEYANRAGATNDYNDYTQNGGLGASDEATLGNVGWYLNNSSSSTHDVGGKQPNAWGLYDTHGNVWEWTTTASNLNRLIHGGCWSSNAGGCCASYVFDMSPDSAANYFGFRLVVSAVAKAHPVFLQANSEAAYLGVIAGSVVEGEGEPVEGEGEPDSCNPDITAPVIALNGPDTIIHECGYVFTDPGVTALDACDGDISGAVVLGGAVILATTLPGTYEITYTVTDRAGNIGSVTRFIQVSDTTPPSTSLNGPDIVTHECGSAFTEPGATALDACNGDITGAVVIGGAVILATTEVGTYEITYTVSDSAGNTGSSLRTVNVSDTTPPLISRNGPEEMYIECGEEFIIPGANAWDSCDEYITIRVETDFVPFDYNAAMPGEYPITYRATDSAGNNEAIPQIITVRDTEPPSGRLNGPELVEYSCNTPYQELGALAWDQCDGVLYPEIYGSVDTTVPGQCELHYQFEDGAGNTMVLIRQVIVRDNCTSNTEPPADDPPTCLQLCAEIGDNTDEDGDGLTACEEACYGTSDEPPPDTNEGEDVSFYSIDADWDGIPDGWEVEHGLDPLRNDAYEDKDGDNLTNLEEYLQSSDPNNSDSPRTVYFVGPTGKDQQKSTVFNTIAFALENAAPASQEAPVAVIVTEGYYREGILELPPYVSLESSLDSFVIVEAQINGAEGAALSYLELRPPANANYLLFMEGYGMEIRGVVFNGMDTSVTGAVLVPEGMDNPFPDKLLFENLFENCLFTNLRIGVDVYGQPPNLRSNIFSDITEHALWLRNSPKTIFSKAMGDETDPNTGFNTFLSSIGLAALVNGRDEEVKTENNDWDTDDPDEIAARIEGPVDFQPFLPKGTGMTAAALFCTVAQAKTMNPVDNASVFLSTLTVTRNDKGVYAFPAVAPGSYTLTVEAPGYQTYTQNVELNESAMMSVTTPLRLIASGEGEPEEGEKVEGEPVEGEAEGEVEGEGEPAPPAKRCGCDRNAESKVGMPEPGEMMLSGLALLVLLAWSGVKRSKQ